MTTPPLAKKEKWRICMLDCRGLYAGLSEAKQSKAKRSEANQSKAKRSKAKLRVGTLAQRLECENWMGTGYIEIINYFLFKAQHVTGKKRACICHKNNILC